MEAELAKVASDLKRLEFSHNQATNDQEEDSSKVAEYKAKLDSVSRLGFALHPATLMAAHPSYLCRPVLSFLSPRRDFRAKSNSNSDAVRMMWTCCASRPIPSSRP